MLDDVAFENGERVMQAGDNPDHDREVIHDSLTHQFNYSGAESKEVQELVEEQLVEELNKAKAEAVLKVLTIIIDSEKPRRAAYQMAYAGGMGAICKGSASKVAKAFGMSRQAFEQEGERLLASLEIRKNPLEKKSEASATYSGTNYRK